MTRNRLRRPHPPAALLSHMPRPDRLASISHAPYGPRLAALVPPPTGAADRSRAHVRA